MGEEVDKKKKKIKEKQNKKQYLPSLEKFTFYHFMGRRRSKWEKNMSN